MLGPSVDSGLNVNEGKCLNNLLGIAAVRRDMDLVHFLAAAGASTALALSHLLDNGQGHRPDALYKCLL